MFIKHRGADYGIWKRGYDEADWLRKQHGITFASVHRDASESNMLIGVQRFQDMKGAEGFASAAPPLMKKIGVLGEPEIWFTKDIEALFYSIE